MLRQLQRRLSRRGRDRLSTRRGGVSEETPCPNPLRVDDAFLGAYEVRSVSQDNPVDKMLSVQPCTPPLDVMMMPVPNTHPNWIDSQSSTELSLNSLAPIAAQLSDGPALSKAERALDERGTSFKCLCCNVELPLTCCAGEHLDNVASNGDLASDTIAAVQLLEHGITTFMDDYHWFMKALDEVAKIHPFVAGTPCPEIAKPKLLTTTSANPRLQGCL